MSLSRRLLPSNSICSSCLITAASSIGSSSRSIGSRLLLRRPAQQQQQQQYQQQYQQLKFQLHYRRAQNRLFTTAPRRRSPANGAQETRQRASVDPLVLLVAAATSVGVFYIASSSVSTTLSFSSSPLPHPTQTISSNMAPQGAPMPQKLDGAGLQAQLKEAAKHMPPGRPGNLTETEEARLKEMWAKMLEIFGVYKPEAHELASATPASPVEKKKSGGGFFGGRSKDTSAADNDKFGANKTYQEALATMTPEELQYEFYLMAKQDAPDAALLRFLRARKWDVQAAVTMLVSALHWRAKEMHVDELLAGGEAGFFKDAKEGSGEKKKEAEDFIAQLRMGKSFQHGFDKEGRPLNYVRVRLHRGGEQSVSSIEKFTVFLIETTRFMIIPPVDTGTIVFDMTGFSMANMDYTPVKFMIKCFEANYPESLGGIVIYKAPWIFQGIWKIIKGWLDPVVAGKVHFASNINEMSAYIDRDSVMKECDGGDNYTYQYVEPKEGENSLMADTAAREKTEAERKKLITAFSENTIQWIKGQDVYGRRLELTLDLHLNYYKLDPYIRARTMYDRLGDIPTHNQLGWDPAKLQAALPNAA